MLNKYKLHIILGIVGLWILAPLFQTYSDIDLKRFAELPVLHGGRVKPIDSLARNSLLSIHESQRVKTPEGENLDSIQWFMDVITQPQKADTYPLFKFLNPEKSLRIFLELDTEKRYFSYKELLPKLKTISQQAEAALEVEAAQRSKFQKEIVTLYNRLNTYTALKNTFFVEGSYPYESRLRTNAMMLPVGRAAFQKFNAGGELTRTESQNLHAFNHYFKIQQFLNQAAVGAVLPNLENPNDSQAWSNSGSAMLKMLSDQYSYHPHLMTYARLFDAYIQNDSDAFDAALDDHIAYFEGSSVLKKVYFEAIFNRLELFYKSTVLYLAIFLLVFLSFIRYETFLYTLCLKLAYLVFGLHSFGLLARMIIQGRPPVTNLYSSAVFVGWGAILIGILLERIFKNKTGLIVSSVVGFMTLIVAHHLSLSGDTLEMMQAVLDTNFWLATHVVVITIGYSGTFLAGAFGVLYILKGVLLPRFDETEKTQLMKVTYGIICFSLLFSFVGTVLGGIWADQSWGRFWGWDPKENGALMIVLWNAIILHARMAGLVQTRGIMVMAVFGNIITAFSWFGVNLLGVGLHSYGFMEKGFFWLVLFNISQIVIISLGLLPSRYWVSEKQK
jgi:ABC-type transport system involved in cytochrome c biogenesis permease subunit